MSNMFDAFSAQMAAQQVTHQPIDAALAASQSLDEQFALLGKMLRGVTMVARPNNGLEDIRQPHDVLMQYAQLLDGFALIAEQLANRPEMPLNMQRDCRAGARRLWQQFAQHIQHDEAAYMRLYAHLGGNPRLDWMRGKSCYLPSLFRDGIQHLGEFYDPKRHQQSIQQAKNNRQRQAAIYDLLLVAAPAANDLPQPDQLFYRAVKHWLDGHEMMAISIDGTLSFPPNTPALQPAQQFAKLCQILASNQPALEKDWPDLPRLLAAWLLDLPSDAGIHAALEELAAVNPRLATAMIQAGNELQQDAIEAEQQRRYQQRAAEIHQDERESKQRAANFYQQLDAKKRAAEEAKRAAERDAADAFMRQQAEQIAQSQAARAAAAEKIRLAEIAKAEAATKLAAEQTSAAASAEAARRQATAQAAQTARQERQRSQEWQQRQQKKTPHFLELIWAVQANNLPRAKELLAQGVSRHSRDEAGKNAADYATEHGNAELIAMLKTHARPALKPN